MSNAKYILKHALILFAIAFVCSLLLILCNALTEERIASLQAESEAEAQTEVLPEAVKFEKVSEDALAAINDSAISEAYIGSDESGKCVGCCVKAEPSGFGGKISMIVGIDEDGFVRGVKITSTSETPGLGANANDEWLKQFKDKSGEFTVVKNGASGDDEISAVSGATITSKAVTSGVNSAESAAAILLKTEDKIDE